MTEESQEYQKAYERAVKLLKIRAHTSFELARKLSLRGFNASVASQVTERLIDTGLVDNQRFAQNFLENLIRLKTFGFYGLKAKLMQRGIDGKDAENLLKEVLSLELESQIAQRLIERSNQDDKLKLATKLSRKGFRSEVIRLAIR